MTSSTEVFTRDPDSDKPYKWDWGAQYLQNGDTLASCTFLVEDDAEVPVTIHDDEHDDTTATVWVTGGTRFTSAVITCRIVTEQGIRDDWSKTFYTIDR